MPVDERDVGIIDYVAADVPGIGGVLKQRVADFVVAELDSAGREIRLEDAVPGGEVESVAGGGGEDGVDGCDGDSDDDGDGGDQSFTRFTLRKERLDTLGAVTELSEQLGVAARHFGFAGLKDYRAITTQEMTVRDVSAAELARVSHPRMSIGHVRAAPRKLKLGQLSGNRFRIVLRGARGGARAVDAALRSLKKRGFANYYGLQRFGDCAARNDEVGRRLLLGDYAGVVDALLRAPEGAAGATVNAVAVAAAARAGRGGGDEGGRVHRRGGGCSSAEAEAREVWAHSGDARTALRLMPRGKPLERELLRNLARLSGARARGGPLGGSSASGLAHDELCRLAVLGLPLGVRRLLAHAYFSRVWNVMASERLRRHGLAAAVEGELVLGSRKLRDGVLGGPRQRRGAVHVVTAAEAAAAAFPVTRVVLPLPGADIQMPGTALGSFYAAMLEHDGIDP